MAVDETALMATQEEASQSYLSIYAMAPINMMKQELSGIYGQQVLADINDVIKYYKIYDEGKDFTPDSQLNFTPSQLKHKKIKSLIDKEARFMFCATPSITVLPVGEKPKKSDKKNDTQNFVDEVLKKNMFGRKLIQAAKDAFIGKRVALFANFNDEGIVINFSPSLEFVYETDPNDVDKIVKIVRYWTTYDSYDRTEQRIYKKKYEMVNGFCHITEGTYNGLGELAKDENGVIIPEENIDTKFEYIPAFVIINDGLSGDALGESEVENLLDNEEFFNKLSNADIDSLRKGMNQVAYTIDAVGTEKLSRAPGAYWDLDTDETAREFGKSAQVGTLDVDMGYSDALNSTLKRIKGDMFESVDMPETDAESLKGVVSSGKTLKAIYWGLMTRCDEKMHVWKTALEWLVRVILDGAELYPNCRKVYTEQKSALLPAYEVTVESNYPLLEDEIEEKASDMMEVNTKCMSRKTYMQKWRGLTDDEVTAELEQIALEREMVEDSFTTPTGFGNEEQKETTPTKEEEEKDVTLADDEEEERDPVAAQAAEKMME